MPMAAQRGHGPTSPAGGVSPSDWRVLLLHKIGAPISWANLDALQAWAISESGYNSTYGTNLAGPLAYNPLAITYSYGVPTTGDVNSVGVKTFASTAAGVDATARFLEHGYQPVIQALRDSDQAALYQAVNQSGWCAGCQGGNYPIGLSTLVGGGTVQGARHGFTGASGSTGTADAQRSAIASQSGDGGGLFGTCGGGTSIPLAPFSLPPFGCYVLNTLTFTIAGAGGVMLMLIGAYFVVSPSLRRTIMQVPVAGGAVAAGAGQAASLLARQAPGPRRARAAESAAIAAREAKAERERRSIERSRGRVARARAREAEARARGAEYNAPGRLRLSGATEAAIKRAQAAPRRGRPDRVAD